jgi:hypothetical protein
MTFDSSSSIERSSPVMLSEAKHLVKDEVSLASPNCHPLCHAERSEASRFFTIEPRFKLHYRVGNLAQTLSKIAWRD